MTILNVVEVGIMAYSLNLNVIDIPIDIDFCH
jgi:hypothetical protein